MRASRALMGAVLALTLVCTLHAQASGPFARVDATDELSLARAADALGDAALAAGLAIDASRADAVIAARASRYAHAPERLIPELARHACGRDPALAPEAAAALRQIALRLTPSELSAREVLRADLRDALSALSCAEERPLPRADIAAALQITAGVLYELTR